MQSEVVRGFLKELVHFTTEPATFERDFNDFLGRVRASGLGSRQMALLRDGIDTGTITSEGMKLRELVRGQLQCLYEEVRSIEEQEAKPWLTRTFERHPYIHAVVWAISILISGVVGFYLNAYLEARR